MVRRDTEGGGLTAIIALMIGISSSIGFAYLKAKEGSVPRELIDRNSRLISQYSEAFDNGDTDNLGLVLGILDNLEPFNTDSLDPNAIRPEFLFTFLNSDNQRYTINLIGNGVIAYSPDNGILSLNQQEGVRLIEDIQEQGFTLVNDSFRIIFPVTDLNRLNEYLDLDEGAEVTEVENTEHPFVVEAKFFRNEGVDLLSNTSLRQVTLTPEGRTISYNMEIIGIQEDEICSFMTGRSEESLSNTEEINELLNLITP
ncbi:MAG: hypothetical protein Q9M91_01845 [Candidatus Dojkabacteria bacterium]|nr:hypothetical protein [Candidatus Dojkabacteria bacterium]MDQ7020567.1 hypothetical protein [Candidatus Dojkabacteria bacterium]